MPLHRTALATVLAAGLLGSALGPTAASGPPPTPSTTSDHDVQAREGTGTWRVSARNDGGWRVSWTSQRRIPVGATLPQLTVAGGASSPAAVAADGRTVTAVLTTRAAPDPGDLDVVLGGDRLDEPGYDPAAGTGPLPAADAERRAATPLPTDPAAPGPHAVVSSDYELTPLRVAGLRTPVEVVGHVVEPAPGAATGPRPLVLLLHGRHQWCYDPTGNGGTGEWPCPAPFAEVPSHLGYDYLQRRLASQGFATVSIRANGVNAQDFRQPDSGAGARSALVQRHLRHWATIATEHQVDLSRVVLVGHSRGGEGVDRAAAEISLDAAYRVVGQVLIAPTDVAAHAAPYIPTVVVLPSCDGDVASLQGQRYVDSTRDLLPDDTALRSAVLVGGANHNWFNTEWTPGSAAPSYDDWGGPARQPCGSKHPDRLTPAGQRSVALGLVTAATRLFTGIDDAGLPLLDGSGATVGSFGDADVRSHALGGGRDVRRPGLDGDPAASAGATATVCRGAVTGDRPGRPACGRSSRDAVTPHWRPEDEPVPTRDFVEVTWGPNGGAAGLRLDEPLDLTSGRLELRTAVDHAAEPVDVVVRLTDGSGRSVDLEPLGGGRLAPLPGPDGARKVWAQAVVVDAAQAPDLAGVELADVRELQLVADGPGRGWLADVSAAPVTPAPVPARRGPRVDLARVTAYEEGDPPRGVEEDRSVLEVPFTLTEPSPVPVRLAVSIRSVGIESSGRARAASVVVPAGATSGAVTVRYTRDRRDDYPVEQLVTVYPVSGAATGASARTVRIEDDDPAPRFRIFAPRHTVTEGEPAVVRLVATGARDYGLFAAPVVGRTPAAQGGSRGDLTGLDVPAAWFRERGFGDRSAPLWREGVSFGGFLGPRRRVLDFVLPTRVDGLREGTETVTMTVLIRGIRAERTIRIRDAG